VANPVIAEMVRFSSVLVKGSFTLGADFKISTEADFLTVTLRALVLALLVLVRFLAVLAAGFFLAAVFFFAGFATLRAAGLRFFAGAFFLAGITGVSLTIFQRPDN
jgi:hypothetical protein